MIGLYLSAEHDAGSGAMIALVAAVIFGVVAITKTLILAVVKPGENL